MNLDLNVFIKNKNFGRVRILWLKNEKHKGKQKAIEGIELQGNEIITAMKLIQLKKTKIKIIVVKELIKEQGRFWKLHSTVLVI